MHTDFQIDHFIATRGNWTPWGIHRQCLREIKRRELAHLEISEQLELLKIDMAELREKQSESKAHDRARNDIRLRQMERGIVQLELSLKENQQELERFRHNNEEALEKIGPITNGQARQLEEETWVVRIRAMVAMNLASEGRVNQSTWRLILSLPPRLKEPLMTEILDAMRKLQSPSDIPDIPLIRWYAGLPALEAPQDDA